jgi:DNA-binding transcriptional LysR family regulator
MEHDLLTQLGTGAESELAGPLRIGGYSSINRSLVLPAVAPFIRTNPRVQLTLMGAEMRTLPSLLFQGEADFVFMDHRLTKAGVDAVLVGEEEYLHREVRELLIDKLRLGLEPER